MEQKRDWAPTIVTWITILASVATGTARFVALEEKTESLTLQLVESKRDRRELAEKVSALETDRRIETKLGELAVQISAIQAQLQALKEDLKPRRRR